MKTSGDAETRSTGKRPERRRGHLAGPGLPGVAARAARSPRGGPAVSASPPPRAPRRPQRGCQGPAATPTGTGRGCPVTRSCHRDPRPLPAPPGRGSPLPPPRRAPACQGSPRPLPARARLSGIPRLASRNRPAQPAGPPRPSAHTARGAGKARRRAGREGAEARGAVGMRGSARLRRRCGAGRPPRRLPGQAPLPPGSGPEAVPSPRPLALARPLLTVSATARPGPRTGSSAPHLPGRPRRRGQGGTRSHRPPLRPCAPSRGSETKMAAAPAPPRASARRPARPARGHAPRPATPPRDSPAPRRGRRR